MAFSATINVLFFSQEVAIGCPEHSGSKRKQTTVKTPCNFQTAK